MAAARLAYVKGLMHVLTGWKECLRLFSGSHDKLHFVTGRGKNMCANRGYDGVHGDDSPHSY